MHIYIQRSGDLRIGFATGVIPKQRSNPIPRQWRYFSGFWITSHPVLLPMRIWRSLTGITSSEESIPFPTKQKKAHISYQSQVINGVKLFFNILEERVLDPEIIKRPKKAKSLPNVLSKQEVKDILQALSNLKHRFMLVLLYSCGLRRSEILNLQVEHIQYDRGMILVKNGKGKKDRVVRFPEILHDLYREYLKAYQPKKYLIEGRGGGQYSAKSLAAVLTAAVEKAGIKKPVTPHWLRHSYATHLHEGGTDIRYIQELLGHQSSKTTEIYTHVSNREIREIRSPIEDMDIKI